MGLRSVFARIALTAVWLSACSESSVLPPVAPSAPPEEKVGRLAIACPADVRTQSFDGRPVAVDFKSPVTTGGQAPITAGCTPEPGHAFDVGVVKVTCDAADVLRQAANCAFQVTVLGPPKLSATRLLAFGDSLTAGIVSSPDGGRRLDPASSYVSLLQRDLQERYVTQSISIFNAGLSGEEARYARPRFSALLTTLRPEVVLLMEGTNDLEVVGGGGAVFAALAIDSMVLRAQATGLDVLLMTVPPQRGTVSASLVPGFNDRIRAIATRRRVVLVDVFKLLMSGSCPGVRPIPCIGADGLHPTDDGYRLIAEELARVIVERYDVKILPAPAGRSNGASPAGAYFEAEASTSPGERSR